jgi:hypothetical protein
VDLLHFSHFHHVSLVQWTNHLLPDKGGGSSRPRDVTHTLELGLPVSTVSLHFVLFFLCGLKITTLWSCKEVCLLELSMAMKGEQLFHFEILSKFKKITHILIFFPLFLKQLYMFATALTGLRINIYFVTLAERKIQVTTQAVLHQIEY